MVLKDVPKGNNRVKRHYGSSGKDTGEFDGSWDNAVKTSEDYR